MRQTNTGVSGRALHNGATGLQETLLFRILDDEQRRAVLDAASGVLEFGFAEDVAAGFFRKALQTDQRSVANRCAE